MSESFDRNDIPLPVTHWQRTHDISRTTMWRLERKGLRILHVGDKRFIRPSDWVAFIEQQDAKSKEHQT
jgi:hypothetical protein